MYRLCERVESRRPDAAREIRSGLERHCRCMLDIAGLFVTLEDVDNGSAIRHNEAFKPPCVAQMLLQQHLVRACWKLIDGVVGTHYGLHLPFGHCRPEGGQVRLLEIARAWIDIESMT